MSESQKKSTFFGGAAILAVSAIFVKVIGAIYRIPLGNILPDDVMGDYNAAYNIYNFFLTISTAGLPLALSKLVSEAQARGREVEGLTISRQSKSPRDRPRTSISAVAMLLAKGTRFWSHRREM